jgi:hypothetical protein
MDEKEDRDDQEAEDEGEDREEETPEGLPWAKFSTGRDPDE